MYFPSGYKCGVQEPESLFTGLVENTGKNTAKVLKEMAQASYARAGIHDNQVFITSQSPGSDVIYEHEEAYASRSPQSKGGSGISGQLLDADSTFALAWHEVPPVSINGYEGSSSDYFCVPTSRCVLLESPCLVYVSPENFSSLV